MDELGELCGGVIFVDDGVDAFETLQDFGADDGDAAATSGDDDGAVCDEAFDGAFLDDVDRLRAGHDTAPTTAGVFFDDPVVLGGELFGLGLGVKLADGLGGILEGGVGAVNDNLRDDGGDLAALALSGESVIDGLGEPVTDLTLAHGDSSLERHSGGFVAGGLLFVDEDVADLGAVAVGNDDFIFASKISDDFTDFLGDFFLGFGGGFTVFLEGVAAESEDDTFFHNIIIARKYLRLK